MIEGFGLERPEALLVLLAVPLALFQRVRLDRREDVPMSRLAVFGGGVRGLRRLQRLALVLTAVMLVLGLAGPYRSAEVELYDEPGIDIALVLDVSLSMLATDFEPDRLTALRRIADDLLRQRSADRIALVIFAKDTFVQSPLTNDDFILRELLEAVTVDTVDQRLSGGTAIGDALLVATDQLAAAKIEGRDQSMLLLTDGESNEGIDPLLAARHVGANDIRLSIVGIGGLDPIPVFHEGEPVGNGLISALDEEALRDIATAAGGSYYRAADTPELEGIFDELERLQARPLETRRFEARAPLAPLAALAAFALFLLYAGATHAVRRPLR